jgi:putative ABC transport system ATP-binding protein
MTLGTEAVVDLRGVRESYRAPAGPVRVLDDGHLSIAPGEVVALAGRSGSGKTTLLTIVAGWDEPDAGTTTVLGADAARPHAWRDMAVLPQSLGLLDELTIAENVTLPIRLARARHALDPDTMMTRLGIHHLTHRYPREVSLGEQQRAALVRAVVLGPRLLIADEPHRPPESRLGRGHVAGHRRAGRPRCLLSDRHPQRGRVLVGAPRLRAPQRSAPTAHPTGRVPGRLIDKRPRGAARKAQTRGKHQGVSLERREGRHRPVELPGGPRVS